MHDFRSASERFFTALKGIRNVIVYQVASAVKCGPRAPGKRSVRPKYLSIVKEIYVVQVYYCYRCNNLIIRSIVVIALGKGENV